MSTKWLIFFLACLLFDSTPAAGCVVLGLKHRDKAKANLRAVSVRGGDLGQIKSKNLAELLSALAAADAVCGVLAPISAMKWFGLDINKGSLSEHYLHGIGASAVTTAISTYLAVSGTTTVKKAIGYGFIARLVSMTLMITTNKYHELGMNNAMFGTMWAILAVTTYALFSGKWEPMALTQFVSLLLGFHGAFLFLMPEKFMKKATGKGESGKTDWQMKLLVFFYLIYLPILFPRTFCQGHG
jgi:hypothetical protein